MARPFKDDSKEYRLTWRYSEKYNKMIEELMYISGMNKSEVMEYVFDYYEFNIEKEKMRNKSRSR